MSTDRDPYFEIRHVVGLEETNLVGNVYYAHYVRWQGRCREMFLKERAPSILTDLQQDLKLFTIRVDCEYFSEITAFDEVSIRMRLTDLTQSQIEFTFDYVAVNREPETLIARGKQRVACMRGQNRDTSPTHVPEPLVKALMPYANTASGPRQWPTSGR